MLLVGVDPGADRAAAMTALSQVAAAHPGAQLTDRAALAADYQSRLQSQALISYLVVAMIVAYSTITLLANLALATSRRRREYGLQRLTGASRGQVVAMMAAVIGIALGSLISQATLIPFSLARAATLQPTGPVWMYLAIAAYALGLAVAATLFTTRLRLRGRPLAAIGVE